MAEGSVLGGGAASGGASGGSSGAGAGTSSGSDGGHSSGGAASGSPASTSTGNSGGGTSGGSASWRDSLPEGIRGDASIQSMPDVPTLAKAFIETKSLVGKKGIVPINEKSTDEEKATFYKSLGMPEAEKYEVRLPDGHKIPEARLKSLKELGHKIGILPGQLNEFIADQVKYDTESATNSKAALTAETQKNITSLRNEWGAAFEKNVAYAQSAVREVGGQALLDHLEKTGLGNDIEVIRAFSKMGQFFGEDKLRVGGNVTQGKTPAEANAEMAAMYYKGSPLLDKTHPGHGKALQDLERMSKMARLTDRTG